MQSEVLFLRTEKYIIQKVSVLVTGNFCPVDKFSTVNVKELKNGLKLDLTIVILVINIK